jgi:hypothetical protein
MLMVIFGAGASYDSCPTYPPGREVPRLSPAEAGLAEHYRLPLANSLFDNREIFIEALNAFPQCKEVVPWLKQAAVDPRAPSVESTLQRLQEEAEADPRGQQTLAAVRCYLHAAIGKCQAHWSRLTKGVSNYLSLLRDMEMTHKATEGVCLVTFNYDTLLEDALIHRGYAINSFEDYVRNGSIFRLFKLHGSVNWAREADYGLPQNINPAYTEAVLRHLVDHADHIHISDRFVFANPMTRVSEGNQPRFPAIAVPVEKKSHFECPPFMLDQLAAALPNVTAIVVIGWRGMEENFLQFLNDRLRPSVRIFVIAGNTGEAGRIAAHLKSSLGKCHPDAAGENVDGFSDFIISRRHVQILEDPIAK